MPSNKPKARRAKVVICRCKSHCTTLNPSTGRYEGEGKRVPRSARDRHTRDDRVLATRELPQPASARPLGHLVESATSAQSIPIARHSSAQTSIIPSIVDYEASQNWIDLLEQEVDNHCQHPVTSPTIPLVFVNDPLLQGEFIPPAQHELARPNLGLYALVEGKQANKAFLATEYRFCEIQSLLFKTVSQASHDLQERLYQELDRMSREKEIHWAQQRVDLGQGRIVVNTEIHFYRLGPSDLTTRAASITSLILAGLFFVPRRALRLQLGGSRDLLRVEGASEDIISKIPKYPPSIFRQFRLDPVFHQFICCTKCHCIYPYKPGDTAGTRFCCTYQRTPDSIPCNTPLWKEHDLAGGLVRSVPSRKYLQQDLKYWLGRLLSRNGIEDLLDQSRSVSPVDPDTPIPDIWFSKIFSDLRDASDCPFFPGPEEEGRLVFSLSVDSFNPFHMKTAKQKASSTGIWLVLLNLPPQLRYLPENVFLVGVIPGPSKPATDEINHYLKPLIKSLLEFWDPGVFFSRTCNNRLGKLFKAMLVPLVADMLGARQILGLPGVATAHYFCTFCDLDIDDLDILDVAEWPAKNTDHIRYIAHMYRDAPTESEQHELFQAYGLRWSALLDLPYWNPVLYAIIDSMHALDLGLFQHHCRKLFQIDITVPGGDGFAEPPPVKDKRSSDISSLVDCIQCIRRNEVDMLGQLVKYHRRVLYTICVDNDIREPGKTIIAGTKWVLARSIYNWRENAHDPNVQAFLSADLGQRPAPALPIHPATDNQLPARDGVDLSLARRIIKHLTSQNPDALQKAFAQGNAAIFAYLCDLIHVGRSHIEMNRRGAKSTLFETVRKSIDVDRQKFNQLTSYLPMRSSKRVVLGKDVMEAVWEDMKLTKLPTWMNPAPPNWGMSERGKLSADQWRVVCTVHLPITLIRLWGQIAGRKREMLAHFMDLVSAVRIANMRIVSQQQIEAYNDCIHRYANRCKELYPNETLKPVLHAALHIGQILDMFGPVHAISAPFYERYINFFHRMNTNKKLGELESTFMVTAARTSYLRAMLADDEDLRQTVIETMSLLETTENEDARGYRRASLLDPSAPSFTLMSKAQPFELGEETYGLLVYLINTDSQPLTLPKSALSVEAISIGGVSYSTSKSTKFRDSNVIFSSPASDDSSSRAGSLEVIFRYSYNLAANQEISEYFLAIGEYLPIDGSDGLVDIYRTFGFAGGYLCQPHAETLHVIRLSNLASHFALTPIWLRMTEVIHILPIDRLMLSFDLASGTAVGDMDEQMEEFEDVGGFAFEDTDEGDFMEDPDDVDDAL